MEVVTRERQFPATVANISVGGAFVHAPTSVPYGEDIALVVQLSTPSRPFLLPAIVRWHRAGGFGLQFLSLGVRETAMIEAVMSARL